MNHLIICLATWFYSGKIPGAPGTYGSLAALPFAYAIHHQWGAQALLIAALYVFVLGVWVSNRYLAIRGVSGDPKEVVIDEVAGQWLLLAFVPPALWPYMLAFVLFRFFDVLKPWPISWCDKYFHGGFGIMFDDMLAGAFGAIVYLALAPYLVG